MRKIILSILAVAAFGTANAQDGGFKAGVNLGLPVGDAGDLSSFGFGVDVAYLWDVAEGFKAGAGVGYSHFIGKDYDVDFGFGTATIEAEDTGFVPIYGTAQYSFTENIFAGVDLGYALGVSPSGNDGGFLYQPKVGYQTEKIEVYAGYKGISVDGGTFSSINLGFNYKF